MNNNLKDSTLVPNFPWKLLAALAITFLLITVLSSCGEDDDPAPSNTPAAPVVQQPSSDRDVSFTAEVKPLSGPNKYQVVLNWKSQSNPSLWVIHRMKGDDKADTYRSAVVDGNARASVDDNVQPGQAYTYFLSSMNDPDGVDRAKVTVSIPVDLEILGHYRPKDPLVLGRLFLRQHAHVLTLGNDFLVKTSELISEGGTIETFPREAKAVGGTNGRPGGRISIEATQATGKLTVIADGENGGEGADGRNGQDGAIGAPGSGGDWGMNRELYGKLMQNFVDAWGTMMRRFPKPFTDPSWNMSLGNIPYYICATPPTNGARGADGRPGEDGATGGNGGDTAAVSIMVQTDSNFSVDFDARPGAGGIGGRGGRGGRGGPGGPPGALDQGHRCPPASTGPSGQDARAGRPGKYGADGNTKPVCVKIGHRVQGLCPKEAT